MAEIKLDITRGDFFGAIIWSFIISLAMLWLVHIVEYSLPTSFRYEYYSVLPAKESFKKWELLSFISTTKRHRDMDMERQDTAYCGDGTITRKYPMQRRPANWTELMTRGERRWIWKYYIPLEDHEITCKMCWSAIWYTNYWYKKIYSYCTNNFKVNQ